MDMEIWSRENESIEDFTGLVREAYNIPTKTLLMLTYKLPQWMLASGGEESPPQTLLSSGDVEVMMSIREWDGYQIVCVLCGAKRVAKYGFLRRSPFNIGNMTFLGDGITEEEHMSAIKGIMFECSLGVLLELFAEEQMVIVHRFSLEIAKARNTIDLNIDPSSAFDFEDRTFSDDEMWLDVYIREEDYVGCGVDETEGLPPLPLSTCGIGQEQASENHAPTATLPQTQQVVGNMEVGPGFWDVMLSQGSAFTGGNYVNQLDCNAVVELDRSNKSLTSLGLQGSCTDSSGGADFVSHVNIMICNEVPNFVLGDGNGKNAQYEKGESSKIMDIGDNEANTHMESFGIDITDPTEPLLNLCLTISGSREHGGSGSPIDIEDSSSNVGVGNGKSPHNPDNVHVGMIFRSREAFKQHMAFYAIRKKFRFRNSRSAPTDMILRCYSGTCKWRVYAVLLKNTELYEVRRVELHHTCSVDDRSGYQNQATHTVIGEIMKAHFSGNGGGQRPSEIMQVMGGDHDVNISYWKAWRSREVALDYAKEMADGIGQRFKYMFLELGASIKGFKYMRKVVIVDGTHLRGKFAGCLLTASAQDGNYQVFPLAVAVVDGENDKSWEWQPSIYYGMAKVYPNAKHCTCILHLKRNIRSYIKDKHLGFLVGKAARAFHLSDFYTTFNEIKIINPSCADYLIGIGFEHWARSHFPGDRYNIMTSNIAETRNSVLRDAREFPIMPLVEYIRAKLMSWFSTRREIENDGDNTLTPRVVEIVEANFENSGVYGVHVINKTEFHVIDKQGLSFHVDLAGKTCSCYEFQMLKIPCTHAIAAANRNKISVDSLVSDCYSLNTFKAAYAKEINPIVKSDEDANLPSQMSALNIEVNPPTSRRPPGRHRKNRILSRGEVKERCILGSRKVYGCMEDCYWADV
ncbi:hypothetical protein Bca4012_084759 [Brassica carinata]